MTSIAQIIARHRPAAFGGVGINSAQEAAFVASHYRYYRKVRGLGARAALEAAKELPATYVKGREFYGPKGGFGAVIASSGSDKLRWTESTADSGLRFVGWHDELRRSNHTGYFTYPDGEPGDTLRGGVWQLPARKGKARLIYGYAEFEGKEETNEGSAAIETAHVVESSPCRDWQDITDLPEIAEAAQAADCLAENAAEQERDYRESYNLGAKAAELDNEMREARLAVLPMLTEFRAVRRGRSLSALLCDMLQKQIRELLARIPDLREQVQNAWRDCPSSEESAWLCGFMDTCEGQGFVRAVRLGFAKRADWKGAADANPLDAA